MATFPDIPSGSKPSKLTLSNPSEENLPVLETELTHLMAQIELEEKITFQEVELVYVDEGHIVEINKEYLKRDYVTDIISFKYDENSDNRNIEGTLFCCAPRILEQSREAGTTPQLEFYRIFVHGLLHLAGYDDQTATEKSAMTRLEDHYLNTLNSDL